MYFQILIFVIMGIFLLWFGYTLFSRKLSGFSGFSRYHPALLRETELQTNRVRISPGDPQVCPICSSRLNRNELVRTLAFPSITGGQDRLMHIRGCIYCLDGSIERICPVCGSSLFDNEILIARMFERPGRRPHVHILGCSQCRKGPKLPPQRAR